MPPITLDQRPASLTAQLRQLAATRPDATAITLLIGDDTHPLTTADLLRGATAYAHEFTQRGVQRGDVVVLVLEHSEAVVYAFWGALLRGAAPSIFPFLSDKLDPDHYFESVRAMTTHAEARLVVSMARHIPGLRQHLGDEIAILDVAMLDPDPNTPVPDFTPDPETVAFLQHSSGSTGIQKGVMLSHRAVINQIAAYSAAIDLRDDDVIVSWLPLYHDMGLIAGFVLPIMQGIPLVLLSPFEWVRDPKRLLHAIDRYTATLCWLPNFAYNFMARQVRDRDFDLSSLRAVINCSEPVYAASHETFLQRFEAHGVTSTMLATCYAMAENTFAVTQSAIGTPPTLDVIDRRAFASDNRAVPAEGDTPAITMVSCGRPIPNCDIRVVDADRQPLPDRHIGEIALKSDSMLTGYHNRPDATATAMQAGWYFTSDLGYIADGELYVTGRMKDLIIVGGKNIYPQDIEYLVNNVPGVHPGRTVAFGVFNDRLGTEDIAVIAESASDDLFAVEKAIRAQIAQHTETTARYVQVVEKGWLIKTSSGKIARRANREKFLREILNLSE